LNTIKVNEIKAAYKHTKVGTFMFNLCAKWTKFLVKHQWLYYAIACTWGIIMTVTGFVVSGVLALAKLCSAGKIKITFKPYHWIYSIAVGPEYWGGCELGLCFLRDHKSRGSLAAHEFGHTFQNCLLGPLFPLMVALPSAIWYWTKDLFKKTKNKPYDSMWFEDAATQCGLYVIRTLNAEAANSKESL
jgi:hypothetical protein